MKLQEMIEKSKKLSLWLEFLLGDVLDHISMEFRKFQREKEEREAVEGKVDMDVDMYPRFARFENKIDMDMYYRFETFCDLITTIKRNRGEIIEMTNGLQGLKSAMYCES